MHLLHHFFILVGPPIGSQQSTPHILDKGNRVPLILPRLFTLISPLDLGQIMPSQTHQHSLIVDALKRCSAVFCAFSSFIQKKEKGKKLCLCKVGEIQVHERHHKEEEDQKNAKKKHEDGKEKHDKAKGTRDPRRTRGPRRKPQSEANPGGGRRRRDAAGHGHGAEEKQGAGVKQGAGGKHGATGKSVSNKHHEADGKREFAEFFCKQCGDNEFRSVGKCSS